MTDNKLDKGEVRNVVVRFMINYAARFLSGSLFMYICWIPFQRLTGWFSYHVILCTFGYIPLMAEAIMMFVGDDIWSRHFSRKAKYAIHGVLIAVATGVTIIGNVLVFVYLAPGYHLYTAHGITGLLSMIILIVALILGLAVNYPTQTGKIIPLRLVTLKFIHNISGLLGYGIGIISLCYGYFTNWFIYFNGSESRWAAVIFTIMVSVWPLNGAVVSLYSQLKSVSKKSSQSSPTASPPAEVI